MFFTTREKNKKFLLLTTLMLLGCFLVVDFASADTSVLDVFKSGGSFAGELILKGTNLILYAILKLVFLLLAGSMWLLNVMISPEIFGAVFFSEVAREGIDTAWSFVRDFFNLFFILIIVLIGLSTILGVGKFKDRTMLVRVAFAAMLINFSKAITLFVIDASQVFMNFFAESIENMDYASQIQNLINFQSLITFSDLGDDFVFFVAIVAVIIMTLIMAVMLFYLAISLIIRMIAFWVLIILSPLAMFGMAMEGTKIGALKNDWFENLTKWSFYGPILLFFIWLSIILISAISGATQQAMSGLSGLSPNSHLETNAGGLSTFIVKLCGLLIPYITAIYLLFYGYDKAMKSSTGMASTILTAGNKKISEWGDKAKNVYRVPIKNTKEMVGEGVKTRVDNYDGLGSFAARRLTKKGRADIQAKRIAKANKIIGGDDGEALKDYNQGKAQEILKSWKDSPPPASDLNGAFESKDEVKKLAATLYKSQNNQLGINKEGVNEYEKATENLKGYSGLQEKIERETKKENLGAVIDYDIKKEMEAGLSEEEARRKVFDKRLQGNFMDVIKNQNVDLYKQPGALEHLYKKHKDKERETKRKWGENIKNSEVEKYILREFSDGADLLGRN